MAKDSKKKAESKEEKSPATFKPKEVAVKTAAPTPAPAVPKKKPPRKVTFRRWFQIQCAEKKYKPHWIAGMEASRDTSGRKTTAEWDKLFETY